MKNKNKILATISIFSVIAINLVFITPAYAAISGGALISMANSARASYEIHTLKSNSTLSASAAAKAQDMLKYDYFAHTSPQGKTPWTFIKSAGYSYIYAGENLAIDFSTSQGVHNTWMASATHRSNILDKDFTEIGIAVATGEYKGKTTTVVVQHFGARASTPQPSYDQSGEKVFQKQVFVQNTDNEKPNEKAVEKQILEKIDLPETKNLNIEINEDKTENIIWYTSPGLLLIRALL